MATLTIEPTSERTLVGGTNTVWKHTLGANLSHSEEATIDIKKMIWNPRLVRSFSKSKP
jgi:hypothetical protein